jgi:type I restriction enzyme S subunit
VSPDTLLQHFDAVADAPNGVQKLRELILQLAVRGKLVPQDPSEEPASVLLERIEAEKQRLVTKGKIGKLKPLPSISTVEAPFELPEGWEWVRWAQVAESVQYGYTASANSSIQDVRLLRITDIQDGAVDWDSVPGCEIAESDVPKYELHEGDLLIARTGGTIGKCYLVPRPTVTSVFASYLIRITPAPGIDPNFALVFARSPLYWEQLMARSAGTGQPNVNGTALSELVFPLPPLTEQRRIVEKVNQLMALCDELEERQHRRVEARVRLNRASLHHLTAATDDAGLATHWQRIRDNFRLLYDAPETVTELRQTILQLAVRGKLVPQDPGDEPVSILLERIQASRERLAVEHNLQSSPRQPEVGEDDVAFPVPSTWQWVRFGDFLDIQGGSQPPKSNFADGPCEGYVRLLQIRDFGPNPVPTYVPEDSVSRFCGEDDVMLARYGASVGKIFMGQQGAYNVALTKIIFDKVSLYNRFIYYLLQSDLFQSYLAEASRSAQAGFNRGNLHPIPLPLPPLPEQRRIVEKVDQLMALCDELEAKLTRSRTKAEKLASAVVHHLTAA